MNARVMAAALLTAAIVVSVSATPAGAQASPSAQSDVARAVSAYAGMQNQFYIPQSSLYRPSYPTQPSDRTYSYHWPFSQAMAATIDMAALSATYQGDVTARVTGLAAYWDGGVNLPAYDSYAVADGGGDRFYDDNAWSGLDLVRVYQATGDTAALSRAEQVFTFARTGWATSQICTGPAGTGGIFWRQQPANPPLLDRNTVSTAPNAELGLELYLATRATDPNATADYLTPATQMFNWVDSYLKDSADGLYWDHVYVAGDGSCAVEQTKWSYNQGTMIGAAVLLFEATGHLSYLTEAEHAAAAALTRYGFAPGSAGFASGSAIFAQGSPFNAIFFRNLLMLGSIDTANPDYRGAMQAYADAVWNTSTVRQTNDAGTLFYFPADGNPESSPPLGYVDLTRQAAMVEIYAGLANAAAALPSAPRPTPGTTSPDWIYFPETQHFLSFGFKDFWLASGGLPVFGYPQTEEFSEVSLDTGQTYTVQYFERQRFEYHPAFAGTPYAVELGRLGAQQAQALNLLGTPPFQALSSPPPSTPGCQFFPTTGHQVCAAFLTYWQSHGLQFGDPTITYRESLALFGYPLSEPFTDPTTGYVTQYFERAVFEYHPTNPDPYKVELQLLGDNLLRARGW